MNLYIFICLGIFIGALFPIQASISARLSTFAKTPLVASFIAFAVGTILLFIVNFIFEPTWMQKGIDLSYSPYVYLGGAMAGVGFNLINIILFAKLGASITTLLTVTGGLIIGILIDHFGWFGVVINPISATVLVGATLMITAIALSQSTKKTSASAIKKHKQTKLPWIIIGILSGSLPPLQTAINGKLRILTGSPLQAAFISFLVGTMILFLLVWIKQRQLKIPTKNNKGKRLPLWIYFGGVFGVFVVTGNIILLPELGSVLTTMVFLFGQMTMALLIDHFGLFHLPKQKITMQKIFVMILMIAGILLVKLP